MRGSTPLDVAASSVMDNNGLALALEEPDLDKVRLVEFILRVRMVRIEAEKTLTWRVKPAGGHLPGRLWSPELPHAPG